MNLLQLKKSLISTYIIFAFVTIGFIGFLLVEDIVKEVRVDAQVIIVDSKGGGNHTTISAAITAASNGDTIYVWAGVYNENIVINKEIQLIGNSSTNTTINGGGTGDTVRMSAHNIEIANLTITGCGNQNIFPHDAGIDSSSADNLYIHNINFSKNNQRGIMLRDSEQCRVENNTFSDSSWPGGVELSSAHNNTITNNTGRNVTNIVKTTTSHDNIIKENKGCISITSGLRNIIVDNTEYQGKGGINLQYSNYNKLEKNIYQSYGMLTVDASHYNIIKKNSFVGDYNAIFILASNSNYFIDNNVKGTEIGINMRYSDSNTFYNNSMTSCGFYISEYWLADWNTHTITPNNTANGKPVYFWKNTTGGTIPPGAGQVILANCSDVIVENQKINDTNSAVSLAHCKNITVSNNDFNHTRGNGFYYSPAIYMLYSDNCNVINNHLSDNYKNIYLRDSKRNNIMDNTILNSGETTTNSAQSLIHLDESHYTNIINNTCDNNQGLLFIGGSNYCNITGNIVNRSGAITISGSYYCKINDNTCTYNKMGIDIAWSDNNNVFGNDLHYNTQYGIRLIYADGNDVYNNNFSLNNQSGIYLISAMNNEVTINNANSNNLYGIWLLNSVASNLVENNNCSWNGKHGIYLYQSPRMNDIIGNTCTNNNDCGIALNGTTGWPYENDIHNNNVSYNGNGIRIDLGRQNNIFDNLISYNTNYGFNIVSAVQENEIYHNNIISNGLQAADTGTNTWNNNQNEGNHWSDYTGVDNGAGGRTTGDGIGDTDIPHLGLDNYPYSNAFGWTLPALPFLQNPPSFSTSGNYTISWLPTLRTTGYVLEEDDNETFPSPEVIYNGVGTNKVFNQKANGTYYYRVKAYNAQDESGWSNIVNISVDWPPSAPTNLFATDITSYMVTLYWDKSPEPDIAGINIYINSSGGGVNGPFDLAYALPAYATGFAYGPLTEETTYYFVLKAFDNNNSYSVYSNVVVISTPDATAPPAPTGLTAVGIANDKIDLSWDASTASDIAGYRVFMNDTGEGPTGFYKLIDTLTGSWTDYRVTGLTEQVEYHFFIVAFDEVPNISTGSGVASATTPDLIPPSLPTGLAVTDETYYSLKISWNQSPDNDVVGYFLYRGESASGPFGPVNIDPITTTEYTDTTLTEDTEYFYKLKAIDDADLRSDLSKAVSGITLIGPEPPYLKLPFTEISIPEDSYVDNKLNLYDHYTDDNNDDLFFACTGQVNIIVTIYQGNGTVVLQPKPNWNGQETLTFSATDDNVSYVQNNVEITVTAVNDPPYNASIIVVGGKTVINKGDTLKLEGACDDPDLVYGDELTYLWSSDLSGVLGDKKSLSISTLKPGDHVITLEVTDSKGKTTEAWVGIKVLDIDVTGPSDGDGDDGADNKGLLIAGSVIAVIVVVVVIVLFLLMRRRKKGDGAGETPSEQQQVQPPPGQIPVKQPVLSPGQPPVQPLMQPGYYPPQPYPEQVQPLPPVQPPWPQEQVQYEQPVEQYEQVEQTLPETPETPQTEPGQEPIPEEPVEPGPDTVEEPMQEEPPEQPVEQQLPLRLVPCPTCSNQIQINTTPCPHCNTTLNWD